MELSQTDGSNEEEKFCILLKAVALRLFNLLDIILDKTGKLSFA